MADAPAISRVFRSDLVQGAWWRFGENGRTVAELEELTPFEQWLNGGPWMNPDYLAVHLRRLADEGHLALVIEDGRPGGAAAQGREIRGEIEVFFYREAVGGGRVAHIGVLQVERGHFRRGLGRALVHRAGLEAARRGCYRVTVVSGEENVPFYRRCGFDLLTPVITVEGRLPKPRTGAGRPKLNPPPATVFDQGYWPIVAGIHPGPGQAWFLYRGHPYPDPEFRAHRLDLTELVLPGRSRRAEGGPKEGGHGGEGSRASGRRAVASFRENQVDPREVIIYCLAEPDEAAPAGGDPSFGGLSREGLRELMRWSADLGYSSFRTYLSGPDHARLRFAARLREISREYVMDLKVRDVVARGEPEEYKESLAEGDDEDGR